MRANLFATAAVAALVFGLAAGAAHAQSRPTLPTTGRTLGYVPAAGVPVTSAADLAGVFTTKADAVNAILVNPTVSGGNTAARTVQGSAATINADAGVVSTTVYGGGGGGVCTGCVVFDALRVSARAQPGSTLTATNAIGAYLSNQNPVAGNGQNGVVIFGSGTAEVNGAHTWGINTTIQDGLGYSIGTGTGRTLIGYESDITVLNASTVVEGAGILGSSLVQPSYVVGWEAGSLSVQSPGLVKYNHSFVSDSGSSMDALYVGSLSLSGANVPSQPISFTYLDAAGVARAYTLQVNAAGGMSVSGPATGGSFGLNGAFVGSDFKSLAGYSLATGTTTAASYGNDPSWTGIYIGNGTAPITLSAPARLPLYTVASLPTCNAGIQNALAAVTDAATPTYNAALTGGGTTRVPVFCNSVFWTSH